MASEERPLVVAVTGAGGYIGSRLVELLCSDERVERVLGFDVRPARTSHTKFVFDELDVRNPHLEARLHGVDVVVHLAFVMNPIHDEVEMRDVNVNGSQNVFKSVGRAGVHKLIYTSSATVYGAHPDNDVPLTEESPLRANLDFNYAAHKLEVEYVVKEFQEEFPDVAVTIFRPAIVFGAHVDNAWSHVLELPVLFGVKGYAPPIQFVHEDDVAAALRYAVFNQLDGVYNLAPPGWLEADDALAIAGRRRRDLPEPVAFSLMDRLWNMGLAEAPAGMLHYLMHPWVVSSEKLARSGFVCRLSSEDALRETVAVARRHVRVGTVRVRRSDIAKGAVAGAGVIGATAALLLRRRRAA